MAIVVFTSALRPHVDGAERLEIDAPRVKELIDTLVERHPGLKQPLAQMAVAIDGQIHGDATYAPLAATSEVHFVPKIGGG